MASVAYRTQFESEHKIGPKIFQNAAMRAFLGGIGITENMMGNRRALLSHVFQEQTGTERPVTSPKHVAKFVTDIRYGFSGWLVPLSLDEE